MLTTLQQAKKLKELGYIGNVYDGHKFYYFGRDEFIYDNLDQTGSFDESIIRHSSFVFAPTVHEALEWFREVKGIHSGIIPLFKLDKVHYGYRYFDMEDGKPINRKESYLFDTHSEAESALLDEVMKYVEIQYSA